ncbi:guanine deaminase [Roseiarcus fermentans]|uniref:Guanine deaminase n=1 Tax=Roseiarcus fermentans TaxID=1473586 RepID=A0A366F205_9HYPH|nr:guanine deaminase [Roseiarcus fermentans]RBP08671.1 guanine deaminase [Roseiarcus fermentans]
MSRATRVVRGRVLSFADDPAAAGTDALRRIDDGAVLVEGGRIAAVGEARAILDLAPADAVVDDHSGALVMPGLIDVHIHYPQTQVIASYGAQLLDWLHNYTFVEEQRFADPDHCARVAEFFLTELFRNGTTTALVYCTVYPQSADAFFAASERADARMIAGKAMLDRNAPKGLLDTVQTGYDDSKALIGRWRGRGRLDYAVTPRFAVTSSPEQLEAAGALMKEFPGVYMQSHVDENTDEIEFVRQLFPEARDYLDVYARAGLLGPRSVFGHCIHMTGDEIAAMAGTGSVAAFCPTSNLFLGSGLFDRTRLARAGVRIGLATDVGGGTSYSMLRTAAEGYKVLQLGGQSWPAAEAFYQMTLGNARALSLDHAIGSIEPGKDADLVVLDSHATPAMAHRMERVDDLEQELFVLMTLGDDRAVRQTYVAGEPKKA